MHHGERLKEERENTGLNQTDFAAIAGASKHAQINWEKGAAFPNGAAYDAWHKKGIDIYYIITGCRKDGSEKSTKGELVETAVEVAKIALLSVYEIRDLQSKSVEFPRDIKLVLDAIRIVAQSRISGEFTPDDMQQVLKLAKEAS